MAISPSCPGSADISRQEDLGALVILPGGEVGTLLEWWNADDGSEWRWRVEFYNRT